MVALPASVYQCVRLLCYSRTSSGVGLFCRELADGFVEIGFLGRAVTTFLSACVNMFSCVEVNKFACWHIKAL